MIKITLNGSDVVAPTRLDAYPRGQTTVYEPLDGDVITQISNNRDNMGDKNTPREIFWELLPKSTSDWTHTIQSLKALEGTEVTLDTSGYFGYTSSLSIKVVNVDPSWMLRSGSVEYYSVSLNYTHS